MSICNASKQLTKDNSSFSIKEISREMPCESYSFSSIKAVRSGLLNILSSKKWQEFVSYIVRHKQEWKWYCIIDISLKTKN